MVLLRIFMILAAAALAFLLLQGFGVFTAIAHAIGSGTGIVLFIGVIFLLWLFAKVKG